MTHVYDLMTQKVITISPTSSLADAVVLLNQHDFIGLPVVDDKGRLMGMFTERSMITDRSYVHMKTLLRLFSQLEFYKKDNSPIKDDLQKIMSLKVADVMETEPVAVHAGDPIEKASDLLSQPVNNPLPVINDSGELVGILALSDLTKLYGVVLQEQFDHRLVDQNIDQFIGKFEKQFVVVSRSRIRAWLVLGIFFVFVGFALAMFLILRINA